MLEVHLSLKLLPEKRLLVQLAARPVLRSVVAIVLS